MTSETWLLLGMILGFMTSPPPDLQVLLYPGALAGSAGQRFQAMVKKGGPLGELVQWADLSACLTILGHNLTFSYSQHHLRRWPPLFYGYS